MKIKGTFLSYISAEKKIRKEQNKTAKKASKKNEVALGESANNTAGTNPVALQYN